MSYFAVEKKKIGWVGVHSNADRLSLTKVEGVDYQCVTGKDEFKVGDDVVYFPIDCVLPKALSDFLNVTNFLTGKEHNRTKTVKLRGEYSQGICVPAQKIDEYLQIQGMNNMPIINEDYAPILGVTKYEPPAILEKGGNLVRLPEFVPVYDIEGADSYPDVLAYLMNKKVWVSEKVEGMNFSIAIDLDGKIFVNQRHHSIEEIEGATHTFWKYSREKGLVDLLKQMQAKDFPDSLITLRGELIGGKIQGNYYDVKDFDIKLFDLEVNRKPLNSGDFISVLSKYDMADRVVPTLAIDVTLVEFLNGKSIKEASNGNSMLKPDKLREGIVIKPMIEERVDIGKFKGRLFIKQRSPEYLSKTDF